MKQSGVEVRRSTPPVYVQASEQADGSTTGMVSAALDATQILQASQASSIAGTQAEFPLGSLAIDTEITLKPGESLATPESLASLQLDTQVTNASPAVTLQSSVTMDAASPFTLQLIVPESAGLNLADPYANLVVLYKIEKASTKSAFSGVITRDKLVIAGGFVRFDASFFGTYQAVITASLVAQAKEVPHNPEPVAKKKRLHFVRGPASATFGDDRARVDAFAAWVQKLTPAFVRVGDATLRTGTVTKPSNEDH